MTAPVDDELNAALVGFNQDALAYCLNITDMVSQEYARNYARMLQNRAEGIEFSLPHVPYGMFEPNRNLIRTTLERMSKKYFSGSIKRST